MNTSFHYDGLDLFRRTEAYHKQKEAYKDKLILALAEKDGENRNSWLLVVKRSVIIAYRMSVYQMRLMF